MTIYWQNFTLPWLFSRRKSNNGPKQKELEKILEEELSSIANYKINLNLGENTGLKSYIKRVIEEVAFLDDKIEKVSFEIEPIRVRIRDTKIYSLRPIVLVESYDGEKIPIHLKAAPIYAKVGTGSYIEHKISTAVEESDLSLAYALLGWVGNSKERSIFLTTEINGVRIDKFLSSIKEQNEKFSIEGTKEYEAFQILAKEIDHLRMFYAIKGAQIIDDALAKDKVRIELDLEYDHFLKRVQNLFMALSIESYSLSDVSELVHQHSRNLEKTSFAVNIDPDATNCFVNYEKLGRSLNMKLGKENISYSQLAFRLIKNPKSFAKLIRDAFAIADLDSVGEYETAYKRDISSISAKLESTSLASRSPIRAPYLFSFAYNLCDSKLDKTTILDSLHAWDIDEDRVSRHEWLRNFGLAYNPVIDYSQTPITIFMSSFGKLYHLINYYINNFEESNLFMDDIPYVLMSAERFLESCEFLQLAGESEKFKTLQNLAFEVIDWMEKEYRSLSGSEESDKKVTYWNAARNLSRLSDDHEKRVRKNMREIYRSSRSAIGVKDDIFIVNHSQPYFENFLPEVTVFDSDIWDKSIFMFEKFVSSGLELYLKCTDFAKSDNYFTRIESYTKTLVTYLMLLPEMPNNAMIKQLKRTLDTNNYIVRRDYKDLSGFLLLTKMDFENGLRRYNSFLKEIHGKSLDDFK